MGIIYNLSLHILPQFVNLVIVLPALQKDILKEINNILIIFIWNNKRHYIQLNMLVQEYKLGGQKHMNLYIIFPGKWFFTICSKKNPCRLFLRDQLQIQNKTGNKYTK